MPLSGGKIKTDDLILSTTDVHPCICSPNLHKSDYTIISRDNASSVIKTVYTFDL